MLPTQVMINGTFSFSAFHGAEQGAEELLARTQQVEPWLLRPHPQRWANDASYTNPGLRGGCGCRGEVDERGGGGRCRAAGCVADVEYLDESVCACVCEHDRGRRVVSLGWSVCLNFSVALKNNVSFHLSQVFWINGIIHLKNTVIRFLCFAPCLFQQLYLNTLKILKLNCIFCLRL